MIPPIHNTAIYTLPSSPYLLVDDRFSILDSDELEVPFWDLFGTLLGREITAAKDLIEILETIAVTLRGSAGTDYGFLRSYLEREVSSEFWTTTWPFLAKLALQMPTLFPEHSLPVLSPSQPKIVLSRTQVGCLVVHQFLCTLELRAWEQDFGYQDFHLWYDADQPHSDAVEAYLTALFQYFNRIADGGETSPLAYTLDEWPITYEMTTNDSGLDRESKLMNLNVLQPERASTSPSVLGLPHGAAVISANKFIGFGRTGTQEETHVGASPEACPVVFFTGPLKDDQVMAVTGAEAMISIYGYGRAAKCREVLKPTANRSSHRETWVRRTMLFMDALELDLADQSLGVPVDLQSGNVERDLRKAYIGFKYKRLSSSSALPPTIFTGLWGCRTFGGDPDIKACIQWCAASLAGCNLTFICSGEEQQAFAARLESFVADMQKSGARAEELKAVMLRLRPADVKPGQRVLTIISGKLKQEGK